MTRAGMRELTGVVFELATAITKQHQKLSSAANLMSLVIPQSGEPSSASGVMRHDGASVLMKGSPDSAVTSVKGSDPSPRKDANGLGSKSPALSAQAKPATDRSSYSPTTPQ